MSSPDYGEYLLRRASEGLPYPGDGFAGHGDEPEPEDEDEDADSDE